MDGIYEEPVICDAESKTLVAMTFAVLWAVEVEKIGWYVLRNRRKRGGEVCGGGGCRWPYSIQYEVQSIESDFLRCTLYPSNWPQKLKK